jgi:hypothetical protein
MGKTTEVSSTDPQECCKLMNGVKCSGSSVVTEIDWSSQDLSGPLPHDILKLKNLEKL